MKKNVRIAMMLVLFVATSITVVAQENESPVKSTPKWISDKGYWVIVSNIKTPKTSVIHFYNNEHMLIYTEKVEGVKLNIERQRTCMRLKRVLDQSLVAWGKMQPRTNQQLVKNIFTRQNK